MNAKDAYIEQLENTIKGLQQQVNNLTEMVLLLRKEKFGSSSEKTLKDEIDGQINLFNEAEILADNPEPEPISKEVKGYTRKDPKTKREEIIKNLPVREILCEIPKENQYCLQCGTDLKPIGKETVREELEYIPAKLRIVRYVRMANECPKCKHTEKPYFEKAPTPTSLMNHSLASPSSVANVMYQKYVDSMPLYRQEKDWENLGIALKRNTMANWIIRCSQDYIYPVIGYMREQLLKRDIVHCDETPLQVLKEEGKKPQTKSYMWLYRSGNDGMAPIILYDYQPSRNGDLTPEERYIKRLELEHPVLDAFWCWVENLTVLSGSALGKAITYAKNQRPYLENYLLYGRCSISNNAAENSIRPFFVGRKNWLFADTPKGAKASAAVYSIVETAKANGLNVYTYLEYLLLYMPDTEYQNHQEQLELLMPWSETVQTVCGK